jgi:pimeloyl-ACP methyl ester carboxylesterase
MADAAAILAGALAGVQSRWADIDGPVHYVDYGGDGPTLVAVHGIGGSFANWFLVAERLRPHFRVLAIDLVGFGLTPLAGRHATIGDNQGLLDAFLRQVVGEPAALMGHSMGGLICMLQAGRHPDSVTRLVLLDPAVPPSDESVPAMPDAIGRVLFRRPRLASAAASLIAMVGGPERLVGDVIGNAVADPAGLDPRLIRAHVELERERLRRGLAYVGYVEARLSFVPMWRDIEAFDRDVLDAVGASTLAFVGEQDRVVPVPSLRRAAERRPDWDWRFLPGVGHDPNFECPALVAEGAIKHLAGRARRVRTRPL